jgi:hypothetical protein
LERVPGPEGEGGIDTFLCPWLDERGGRGKISIFHDPNRDSLLLIQESRCGGIIMETKDIVRYGWLKAMVKQSGESI